MNVQQIKRCMHWLHSLKYLLLSEHFFCLLVQFFYRDCKYQLVSTVRGDFLCCIEKLVGKWRSIYIRFNCIVYEWVRDDLWKFKLDIIGFMVKKIGSFCISFLFAAAAAADWVHSNFIHTYLNSRKVFINFVSLRWFLLLLPPHLNSKYICCSWAYLVKHGMDTTDYRHEWYASLQNSKREEGKNCIKPFVVNK